MIYVFLGGARKKLHAMRRLWLRVPDLVQNGEDLIRRDRVDWPPSKRRTADITERQPPVRFYFFDQTWREVSDELVGDFSERHAP